MSKSVKVSVRLTITVDADVLMENYGLSLEEIRNDVRYSVLNATQTMYGAEGAVIDADLVTR